MLDTMLPQNKTEQWSAAASTCRRKTQGYRLMKDSEGHWSKELANTSFLFLTWQDTHKHTLTGKLHGVLIGRVHNHALFATCCATIQLLYAIIFECLNHTFGLTQTSHSEMKNATVYTKHLSDFLTIKRFAAAPQMTDTQNTVMQNIGRLWRKNNHKS